MKKTVSAILALIMIAAMFTAFAIPSSASALPAEYVKLEYAESDGTQLIVTDIFSSPKLKIECDFQIVDPYCVMGSAGVAGVVGAYWNGNQKPGRFQFGCSRSGTYFSFGMGELLVNTSDISKCTPADGTFAFTPFDKDDQRHTIIMDAPAGTISLDGNTLGQVAADKLGLIDVNDPDNGANLPRIILFASNNAVGPEEVKSSGVGASRIYSCKFYMDGQIVADFIPCYRVSDKYVGMYDAVGQKFYENYLYEDTPLLADPAVLPTTEEPTTETPTTEEPRTDAPAQSTEAPVVTDAPVQTDAPKTDAPGTDAPKTEKKGCGSSAAIIGVCMVMTLGCAVIRKKA